jgi:hypothetical protein
MYFDRAPDYFFRENVEGVITVKQRYLRASVSPWLVTGESGY